MQIQTKPKDFKEGVISLNPFNFYFVSLSDGDGSVRVRFLQSTKNCPFNTDPASQKNTSRDAIFDSLNFVMEDAYTPNGEYIPKGRAYVNTFPLLYNITIFTIAFDGIHCKKLLSDIGLNIDNNGEYIDTYDFDGLKKIHDELCRIYPADADLQTPEILSQITAKSYFYRTLHCLENESVTHLETAKRKLLVAAEEYMRNNFSKGITVEDTSEYLSIDRRYLYKLFKKYSGISPKQYLSNIKIARACDLLLNSDMSITDVAEKIGYTDSLQFSAFFKKQTGISPRKYRNTSQINS